MTLPGPPGGRRPRDLRLLGQRALGTAGASAATLGGWAAGAVPASTVELLPEVREHADAGLFGVYFGVTLLLGAWVWLGRDLSRGSEVPVRTMLVTFCCWAAPLLAAPAVFSRDVYSYLAQGALALAGFDVYTVGVGTLGGPLAAEVPSMWQHTPAPYGPVAVGLSVAVAAVTGKNLLFGVLGMRLVALLGVALLLRFLPELARRCGVNPAGALWLAALNPLVLLHLIGGAHNDAIMLGLLVSGLALAVRGDRPVLATILITGAALVKAPAVAGLLVAGRLWRPRAGGPRAPGGRTTVAAALRTLAVAGATTVLVTSAVGTGYGWFAALASPVSTQSWSASSAVGRLARDLLRAAGSVHAGSATFWARWLFLAAFAVIAALLWRRRRRLGPLLALGLGLGALALLGPATRPWYALWGVVIIAAAASYAALRWWCAAISAVLALLALPSGFGPQPAQAWLAASAVLLAAALLGTLLLGSAHLGTLPSGSAHLGTLPLGSAHLGTLPLGSAHLGTLPLGSAHLGTLPSGATHLGTLPESRPVAAR
jgi:alpha-1,6-mannosyltransferase